jgi:hypothetical protein
MTMNQMQAMIDAAVAKALATQMPVASQPKAVKQDAKPTASAPQLTDRHKSILAQFKRRGIKDPKLFTDIKPYGLWQKAGFQVRKDQKSVKGLFHRSQVDPIKN